MLMLMLMLMFYSVLLGQEKNDFLQKLKQNSQEMIRLKNDADYTNQKMKEQSKTLTYHMGKYEDLKGSTVTLTNALVRLEDDNSVRALSEGTQQSEVLRMKSALEKANSEVSIAKTSEPLRNTSIRATTIN